MTDDMVWLSVRGQKFGGWTAIRVTRGIELMPGHFQVALTERYPDQPKKMDIEPGDAVIVQIGADIVLTGWIDRVMAAIDTRGHHITVIGRGRCADLVDCSAFADNRQFLNRSVLDIATAVCAPFQIVVSQRDPGVPVLKRSNLTADGQIIPQLNVNLTTTPWQIVEEMARFASLLAYENPFGNLILAQVGTAEAASGFSQGVNVQSAASMLSLDQRYSEIWALALAVDTSLQLTPGLPTTAGTSEANKIAIEYDKEVPRRRPLVIISEQGWGAWEITQRRAKWEIARRYGRSQAVTITADSWRDAAGDLWAPNTLAPVDLPALHLGGRKWLISEVSFVVDDYRGKVAEVTLMPKEAFTPQPPSILFDWQVQQAIQESAAAQPRPDVGPAHA
jgi:prophage tail gpP-like protein